MLRYDGEVFLHSSLLLCSPTCGPTEPQPPSFPISPKLKDLKRQLHLERKRADKLQERLQDILTNSKSRSGERLGLQGMLRPRMQGLGLNARAASCTSLHVSLVSPDPLELDLSFPFSLYLSVFIFLLIISFCVPVFILLCLLFLSLTGSSCHLFLYLPFSPFLF